MICNQYLEDFKIDLLGLGYASRAASFGRAGDRSSWKVSRGPPLNCTNLM